MSYTRKKTFENERKSRQESSELQREREVERGEETVERERGREGDGCSTYVVSPALLD